MIRKTKDGATYGCPAPGALNIMINPAGQETVMQTWRHGNSALSYPGLKALYAASQLGTKPGGPR